jgi:DNA-binding transcriptional LysR family regulator
MAGGMAAAAQHARRGRRLACYDRPVASPLVRPVDLAELRAFCAAVDLGSLGAAARALGVSQPALSKRMRELEALAGTKLLERHARGTTPTAAGERLYLQARKLLAQAEEVEALLVGLRGEQGPVHLAASHTIAEYVLPGPLVDYERRHERHLSVELVIANSVVVRELVRDGRAEFGIAALEPNGDAAAGVRVLPFCDDEVVLAVPRGHPWAERSEIALEELAATPMVLRDPSANTRRVVDAELAQHELSLAAPLAEVGSTSAAIDTALGEDAPVLLSRMALKGEDRLVVRPVADLRFLRKFAFLLGPRPLSPSGRALLSHLQAITTG